MNITFSTPAPIVPETIRTNTFYCVKDEHKGTEEVAMMDVNYRWIYFTKDRIISGDQNYFNSHCKIVREMAPGESLTITV